MSYLQMIQDNINPIITIIYFLNMTIIVFSVYNIYLSVIVKSFSSYSIANSIYLIAVNMFDIFLIFFCANKFNKLNKKIINRILDPNTY